jgi:hypothetical protein
MAATIERRGTGDKRPAGGVMKTGQWWDVLRMRFRSLAKRQRVETELDKELRYHVERQTEENIADGTLFCHVG